MLSIKSLIDNGTRDQTIASEQFKQFGVDGKQMEEEKMIYIERKLTHE